ncbi:hypothetical protein B0A55_08374 [Friedmanniomyces simplex]|uniref:Uncharacterized protein n=1 Tax=Friedmanniomyces simplex TaxID=329884 RepID=A0A4U0WWC0_9PEZI|nr:hypothetical protein B0A55_08374 [Friedmanniomyces simplex]
MAPSRNAGAERMRSHALLETILYTDANLGLWPSKAEQDTALQQIIQDGNLQRKQLRGTKASQPLDISSLRGLITKAVNTHQKQPKPGEVKKPKEAVFELGSDLFTRKFLDDIGFDAGEQEQIIRDGLISEKGGVGGGPRSRETRSTANVEARSAQQSSEFSVTQHTETSKSGTSVKRKRKSRATENDYTDAEDAGMAAVEDDGPPRKKTKGGGEVTEPRAEPITEELPVSKSPLKRSRDATSFAEAREEEPARKRARSGSSDRPETADSEAPFIPYAWTQRKRAHGVAFGADEPSAQGSGTVEVGMPTAKKGKTAWNAANDERNVSIPSGSGPNHTDIIDLNDDQQPLSMEIDRGTESRNSDQGPAPDVGQRHEANNPASKGPEKPTGMRRRRHLELGKTPALSGRTERLDFPREQACLTAMYSANGGLSRSHEMIKDHMHTTESLLRGFAGAWCSKQNYDADADAIFTSSPAQDLEELYVTLLGTEDWQLRLVELQNRRDPSIFQAITTIEGLAAAAVYKEAFNKPTPWDIERRFNESLGDKKQYFDETMRRRGHVWDAMLKYAAWLQAIDEEFQETEMKAHAKKLAHKTLRTMMPHLKSMIRHPDPDGEISYEPSWVEQLEHAFLHALMLKSRLDATQDAVSEYTWLPPDTPYVPGAMKAIADGATPICVIHTLMPDVRLHLKDEVRVACVPLTDCMLPPLASKGKSNEASAKGPEGGLDSSGVAA